MESYRGELELQAHKMKGLGHSQQEIERLVKIKEEEVARDLMQPQDRDQIEKGFRLLISAIDSLPEKSRIVEELETASMKYDSIEAQIGTGPSVQELLGISNETFNLFYSQAFNLFNEGINKRESLEDASSILMYLTHLNEYIYEPHLLLGYTHHQLGNFKEAIKSYESAAALKPDEFEPQIRKVECTLLLDEKQEALRLLDIISTTLSEGDMEHREIIQSLKASINTSSDT